MKSRPKPLLKKILNHWGIVMTSLHMFPLKMHSFIYSALYAYTHFSQIQTNINLIPSRFYSLNFLSEEYAFNNQFILMIFVRFILCFCVILLYFIILKPIYFTLVFASGGKYFPTSSALLIFSFNSFYHFSEL